MVPAASATLAFLTPDRVTVWNPGMRHSVRSTLFSTLTSRGSALDDTAQLPTDDWYRSGIRAALTTLDPRSDGRATPGSFP